MTENFNDGAYEYSVLQDSSNVEVVGLYNVSATVTDPTIPNTVSNGVTTYNVTNIKYAAFLNKTNLTGNLTIPNSVTSIGNEAFKNCSGLESVTFEPTSQLKTIGEAAFISCGGFTAVTIPNSVTSIGNQAFNNCIRLTTVTFEPTSQLKTIGVAAFYNCTSLTTVTIPNGVTSIGNQAFNNCIRLTGVTIPDSVTSIGDYAFFDCTSLIMVVVANPIIITTPTDSYTELVQLSFVPELLPQGVSKERTELFTIIGRTDLVSQVVNATVGLTNISTLLLRSLGLVEISRNL